jgi:hypothetical protein
MLSMIDENTYLDRFTKAFVVQHDPRIPQSKVVGIVKTMLKVLRKLIIKLKMLQSLLAAAE